METQFGLLLNEKDNVGTALQDVKKGNEILLSKDKQLSVIAVEDIPYGFKFSLFDIRQGEAIFKYGEVIGRATVDIKAGSVVHVHNLEGQRARGDLN